MPLLVNGECVEQLKIRQKEKSMLNSVVVFVNSKAKE